MLLDEPTNHLDIASTSPRYRHSNRRCAGSLEWSWWCRTIRGSCRRWVLRTGSMRNQVDGRWATWG